MLNVTLDDLKQYLSIKPGMPTQEDAKLQDILNMSIAFVRDYTGIEYVEADQTKTFEDYLPYPNNRLVLDTDSAESVLKILVDNVETSLTANVMRGYMVVMNAPVKGFIQVVYKTKQSVPRGEKALEVAIMELSKFYYKQEYKVSIQAQGESISYDKVSYIPAHVKSILDMYRRA